VVALLARERGGPRLRHQVLIYPVTDHDFERASYRENGEGYFLTTGAMRWFWDHYVPERGRRDDWSAAPLRAEKLAGLPPATVITAEYDPLRDEARPTPRACARRASRRRSRATTARSTASCRCSTCSTPAAAPPTRSASPCATPWRSGGG